MSRDAQNSWRTVLIATFVAVIAFFFFEHTAWLILAFCVLIGYCGRAYVQQSQPEIAQMQMHDMVDHTALHSQSQGPVAQSSGMAERGSSADKPQRLGASAQPGSVGAPSDRQQDTATAPMPSDSTSSEQFADASIREKAPAAVTTPDAPDNDFTFPDVRNQKAHASPAKTTSASPAKTAHASPAKTAYATPAIQAMQPIQHMDPMQQLPPASQGYAFQAQSTAPQVNLPGGQTASQTTTSQVSNSSESFAQSSGNEPPVHQYQESGVHQQVWSSEVGDGQATTTEAGGSTMVYGRPELTTSQVPLLPDDFSFSSEGL